MDKKDQPAEGKRSSTLENARSTIMKTVSALISTASGSSNAIPAPAPSTANNAQQSTTTDRTIKPPKDLNQLLRVCAELTPESQSGVTSTADQQNDGVQSSGDNESAADRRKFLENAVMNLGMAGNIVEELKDAIRRLSVGPSEVTETIEKQIEDLKFISYHVDDLDLANDFLKVGGLPVVLKYLNSQHGPTRKETFNILACIPQNNPFAWSFYQQLNVLPIILEKLVEEGYGEGSNEGILDCGFSAISCLIRGNANAILQLKGYNGEDLIYTILLSSERTKTIRKAGYILRSLLLYDKEHNGPLEVRDYYKAIVQELCDRIRLRRSPTETLGAILQVIFYILSEHEELLANYKKPEVGLAKFVQEVLQKEPNDDDSFETMETYNAATELQPLLDL